MAVPILIEKVNINILLEAMVEAALDGIFLTDTTGNIIWNNREAQHLFGYNADEFRITDISSLFVFSDPGADLYSMNGSAIVTNAKHKNGTIFPARLVLNEIQIDEQKIFSAYIHDLSEAKSIEKELLKINHDLEQMVIDRTTELQEAINRLLDTNLLLNQSIEKHKAFEAALLSTRDELKKSLEKEMELGHLKSRFISMASHEFKTPLSSILSSAALIARYDKTEQSTDRNRHVERIKASVTHLNTILTDFLSITRLEEGRFEPQISRFMIDSLVSDLLSEIEVLLKPRQALTFKYKTDKLQMESDKNIFRNIIYNLLSNAIKYSDENSSIACKVKRKGSNIIIEIKDEGIGIPAKDRQYIGTRFFRSSNVTHLQGTGLGLNIVRAYLNYLRGSLSFKSHEDRGTTFIVTIPSVHEK